MSDAANGPRAGSPQRGRAPTKTNLSVPCVALKAPTRRTRSVSVASAFILSRATENTEKKHSRKNNTPATRVAELSGRR
jgi:hypothetical protein